MEAGALTRSPEERLEIHLARQKIMSVLDSERPLQALIELKHDDGEGSLRDSMAVTTSQR